jgi:flagellar biosynthetic protein FliR
MSWLSAINLDGFLLFTLVLARMSGLVMTAPIYGTQEVPAQVRALLAFALALLVTPSQLGTTVGYPGSLVNYGVMVGSELLIGVSLGTGIMILFSGIQLAGQTIGRTSGMMLAEVVDPAIGESVPQIARLLHLVTMAIFVAIGGHRIVMAGLLDTFAGIPPGGAAVPTSIAEVLVELVTQSFVLGIRASAPVVTALLLSTLVMGLISRTLPQLNILAVGFGMNAMLTFGTLMLSLGAAAWVFQDQVEPALELILEALHAPFRSQWLI